MARPAEPGRTALLEAGRRLLRTENGPGISKLSANAVVAEASMSKGAFFHHFPTRRDYVHALHSHFHEQFAAQLAALSTEVVPGRERLRHGIVLYLDFCVDNADTKSFLFDARADADLAEAVAASNRRFAQQMEHDLAVVGWRDVNLLAPLIVAAIAETALLEMANATASPALRQALFELIGIGDPESPAAP